MPSSIEPQFFFLWQTVAPPASQDVSEKRKFQFQTGRALALSLIEKAGPLSDLERERFLTRSETGMPHWPESIRGSITHKQDRFGIVVFKARENEWARVGIDTENLMSEETARRVASRILTESEAGRFTAVSDLTLIFSAKETLFKALYPEVNDGFGFDAAETVSIDRESPEQGKITLALTEALSETLPEATRFEIAYRFDSKTVLTFLFQLREPTL